MHGTPAPKSGIAPFNWEDPFDLESQLSEEERMIRDAAHGFAQGELQPRVIDAFREEMDAPELFPLMGQAGLLGATIPEEFGGAGASYVAYGLIAREIERVDSGYRSMA
ncbi:MAG: acyl-CoA dehydrogenase family protein, partial [Erythrobacter sp.]|nr:acyl-CoA dehydrogenase family protein [Erythrobacter sp.]